MGLCFLVYWKFLLPHEMRIQNRGINTVIQKINSHLARNTYHLRIGISQRKGEMLGQGHSNWQEVSTLPLWGRRGSLTECTNWVELEQVFMCLRFFGNFMASLCRVELFFLENKLFAYLKEWDRGSAHSDVTLKEERERTHTCAIGSFLLQVHSQKSKMAGLGQSHELTPGLLKRWWEPKYVGHLLLLLGCY